MNSEKAALIVSTLLERTSQGAISWTAMSNDSSFEASFPKVAVRVAVGPDQNGDDHFYVEVINKDGKVVDSITAYSIREKFSSSWEALKTLFSAARDKALGIDQAVDDLLESLGGAVTIPAKKGSTLGDSIDDEIPF